MSINIVKIKYPEALLSEKKLMLCTDIAQWDDPIPAVKSEDNTFQFEVESEAPYFRFKPCLVSANGEKTWSVGSNYLSPLPEDRMIYPSFKSTETGQLSEKRSLDADDGEAYYFRVYTPPGYEENTERRFPVCFMHDGHNLFFPTEAFAGQTWEVKETLELLDKMNSIEPCIVVALYPNDRMVDYSEVGAARYADFLINKLVPYLESELRLIGEASSRVVMGSSLGGLISFYLAWHHSDVFGRAACLSSTFGYKNTLFERVAEDEKPPIKLYLDSGWPGDNFAETQAMAHLLLSRGFKLGVELNYLAIPQAEHSEVDWGERLHLPFQFLLGLGYGDDPVIDPPTHPFASKSL